MKHNQQQVQTLALFPTPMESLLTGYLKARFEVGETFVLPGALAALPRSDLDFASSVVLSSFVDACFQPCKCTGRLVQGSVVFSVVDSDPNRRKVHGNNLKQKSNSIVLVRVHDPMPSDGTDVPVQSRNERWDLRSFFGMMQLRSNCLVVSCVPLSSKSRVGWCLHLFVHRKTLLCH